MKKKGKKGKKGKDIEMVRELLLYITESLDDAEKAKSKNDFDAAIEEAWGWVSGLDEELTSLRVERKKTAIFDAAWAVAEKKGYCDAYGGSEYRHAKAEWIASGRKTSVADLP